MGEGGRERRELAAARQGIESWDESWAAGKLAGVSFASSGPPCSPGSSRPVTTLQRAMGDGASKG